MTPLRNAQAEDPWHSIRADTDRHRAEHGCWAYPHANGRLLGVLAAATGATRILELGTALGYTAVWLAHGAPRAQVDTLERDSQHVALARAAIERAGFAPRIRVHQGDFSELMPGLQPGYDVAFLDGYAPTPADLAQLRRLVRPGGLLISANQQLPGRETAAYRAQLLDPRHWLTASLGDDGETALSIRRDMA